MRCSAACASAIDGIVMVLPSTTCALSFSPLAAARARVVKLFEAAIDQSDSPGWTTCATPAEAGEAASKAMVSVSPKARIRFPMTPRLPRQAEGDPRYTRMQGGMQDARGL